MAPIKPVPDAREALDSSQEGHVVIPKQDKEEASRLLKLPAEVRVRIYEALFAGLVLRPGWRDFGPGSRNALGHPTERPIVTLMNLLGKEYSENAYHPGEYRPRSPSNLDILCVCRKIYEEAHTVLFRVATFCVATIEDHIRLTQRLTPGRLKSIRSLSISNSVLPEWPSTWTRLLMHSLSHLEIRDLEALINHESMLTVDSMSLETGRQQPMIMSNTAAPVTPLLETLLMSMTETGRLLPILSHLIEASTIYDRLILHFRARCDSVWDNLHRHDGEHIVFTFGKLPPPSQPLGVSTLPEKLWKDTILVSRRGFDLESMQTDNPLRNWQIW